MEGFSFATDPRGLEGCCYDCEFENILKLRGKGDLLRVLAHLGRPELRIW